MSDGRFDLGLVLPTLGAAASREAIDAAAAAASRLGWASVWTTDHTIIEDGPEVGEYGCILEALTTLTYIAARHEDLRVGFSVIIPAIRDAPLLAKQLATLDTLSEGRLIVGVGASDKHDDGEYANLGKSDRFPVRGRYLDESIDLWRHLWSGSTDPFEGEFHRLSNFVFRPLPPQGAGIPIWCGGRSGRAVRRTGRVADGYHAAQTGPGQLRERLPSIEAAAAEHGRSLPAISVRARVRFDEEAIGVYSICGGEEQMQADIAEFIELGVEDLILVFPAAEPSEFVESMERFEERVMAPVRAALPGRVG